MEGEAGDVESEEMLDVGDEAAEECGVMSWVFTVWCCCCCCLSGGDGSGECGECGWLECESLCSIDAGRADIALSTADTITTTQTTCSAHPPNKGAA